jgi:AcrR family transcriptional regulator
MTAKKDTPRNQGRPTDSQSAVGEEALIEATIRLLQSSPPSKVTRRAIAKAAGAHPSLVGYYFGTREALLLAALRRLAEATWVEGADVGKGNQSPSEELADSVRGSLDFTMSVTSMHQLMLDELAQSKSPEAREAFTRMTRDNVDRYRRILADGEKSGAFDGAIDPLLLHLVIVATTDFIVPARPIIAGYLGEDVDFQEVVERYRAFVQRLLLKGLAPSKS